MIDFSRRSLKPELMDQPGLDAGEHRRALTGLARINYVSRSAAILWPPIRRCALALNRPLRVLDVASGGGDVAIDLWHKAQRAGICVEIQGLDVSRVAVDYARNVAKSRRAPVQFERLDVLTGPLPTQCDVTISSLFLHHLAEDAAIDLLARMADAANRLVLVNDLLRSCRAYLMAQIACRILTTSRVVHIDGPRSVTGAFTPRELANLFRQAGLSGVKISRRWPYRMLAEWRRL